jgi:predicted nucleotidyltransferase
MSAIAQLAIELGAPERTLRRAVALGSVRARRLSERRLRLTTEEREYQRGHWALLADLRSALRTEPAVRTAVLVGSTARGDDVALSDIDLIVDLAEGDALARQRLGMRLGDRIGRSVDVADLTKMMGDDPLSLLQALDEGRPLVDRTGKWHRLLQQRPAVYRRAARSYRQQRRRATPILERVVSA